MFEYKKKQRSKWNKEEDINKTMIIKNKIKDLEKRIKKLQNNNKPAIKTVKSKLYRKRKDDKPK